MKKISLLLFIITIDQFLKYLSIHKLLPSLGGVFYNTCNPILSWGIPLEGFWFWFLWIIAFGGLIFLIKKYNYNIYLIIVLAGAVSNFFDRILHGCVIDFIKIYNFPIFNLADICITLGIILFIVNYITFSPSKKRN